MGYTDTQANSLLDTSLSTATHVGLYTTNPATSGSGGTEVTGGSYARQAVTMGSAASRVKTQSGTITFPTASADWGTVTGMGFFTAVSAGTLIAWFALTANRTVSNGAVASFANGAITVTLT